MINIIIIFNIIIGINIKMYYHTIIDTRYKLYLKSISVLGYLKTIQFLSSNFRSHSLTLILLNK